VSGRKRHVLVDTQGLLLEVAVHAASVQERAGGETLLARAKARPSCGRLARVWADGGYDGEPFRGFVLLPRRWVVERSFGRLGRSRRLSKDYEQTPASEEAFVRLAMTRLMLRRLRPGSTD
jgi:transposase